MTTTRAWYSCLEKFEVGGIKFAAPKIGRHRADNRPLVRVRRDGFEYRCTAPQNAARGEETAASTKPGWGTAAPLAAYCLDCVEGSGIRADGTDCVTCGGIGVPKADAPAVRDEPGRRRVPQDGESS